MKNEQYLTNDFIIFAKASEEYIYNDLVDISRSFIRLGFHLNENARREFYKHIQKEVVNIHGNITYEPLYKSIYEYACFIFDLSKSTVSRLMAINHKFCNFKNHLLTEYEKYSFSQLSEMLSLDEKNIKRVSPDMTISEIRELKSSSNSLASTKDVIDLNEVKIVKTVATSQQGCNMDLIETTIASDIADEAIKSVILKIYKKQIPKEINMDCCECGMMIDDDWDFCPKCGQAIGNRM